LTLLVRSGLKR